MSHAFIISTLGTHGPKTDADAFVQQLREQWPTVQTHVIRDPNSKSVLQWKIVTDEGDTILGDLFGGQSVAFKGGTRSDIANFALWFRTLIPSEHRIFLYKEDLSHQPNELTDRTTLVDIIAGLKVPFDPDWQPFDRPSA
jgi:hypothetical protein